MCLNPWTRHHGSEHYQRMEDRNRACIKVIFHSPRISQFQAEGSRFVLQHTVYYVSFDFLRYKCSLTLWRVV
jgi:hypothetical protein